MNKLLDFWSDYGIVLVIIGAFVLFMLFYYLKSKKYQNAEYNLYNSLKVGDKVKTYSGFYGTVAKITETTDGRVVTLALGGDAFVDVDVRAIAGIDAKEEIVEEEKPAEEVPEVKVELPQEEPKEKEEKVEEKPAPKKKAKTTAKKEAEEKAEEPKEEKAPKKRGRKPKAE